MSRNALLYLTGIVVFVALAGYALWQELLRNEVELSGSLSGTILATPRAGAEIVKTDNAYLLLVDPDSFQIVATKVINPFLPPTTFLVGTDDAQGAKLSKQVRLLVLTDKDGDPNRPASGEVIGPLSPPYNLGHQGIEYTLDRPFQSFPPELLQSRQDAPEQSISGHITIADSLKAGVSPEDRLVVMLFDPKLGRPAAIRIMSCQEVADDFHSRFGALGKTYAYRLCTLPILPPFDAGRAWHLPRLLNPETLEEALALFRGTHDFRSFAANRGNETAETNYLRTITEASFVHTDDGILLRFTGNGFLYKMVRLLTGAAVNTSQGYLRIDDLKDLVEAPSGAKSPLCAPADGLTLLEVNY